MNSLKSGKKIKVEETNNEKNSTDTLKNGLNSLVIGVCGGTSSGKTTLAQKIWKNLVKFGLNAVILSQDSFYKNLSQEQLEDVMKNKYNFDHPNAIDFVLMKQILEEMIRGKTVEVPIYDFCTHQRTNKCKIVTSSDIIILEGIFIFSDSELRDLMTMKLFVDVDSDTRLIRRIRRDLTQRGRDINQVLDSYEKYVKPGFISYILPYRRFADLIIPNGGNNQIAIDLISHHITNRRN